jgi:glycosyltransferase involved in cell wall biosynthesis
MTAPPTFSVVVPVFNEAEVLPEFHRRLAAAINPLGTWEAVYVNDGSRDMSLRSLETLHAADDAVAIVNLSRNFGKEIAVTAGLAYCSGEAVIVIDADLQDPPELIPELVAGWREGFDMIYAERRVREGEGWLKRTTARIFYILMHRLGPVQIPRDTGDFRLISRRVVDSLLQLKEQHRFMKGLFAWVGFPAKSVRYDRAPRHSGTTKWSYWKLWNLAIEGITGFTIMPLKVATYLGLMVALFAAIFGAQIVIRALLFGNPVPGYPSMMATILFLGGAQLITLGIIGEYLGRVFDETKHRPLYLVERFVPSRTEARQSSQSQIKEVVYDTG